MGERSKGTETEQFSVTEHLRYMRDEYSDEIPQEIIHSNNPNNKYKARKGWFLGVLTTLELGIQDGTFTNPSLQEEIRDFVSYYRTPENLSDKPLTSAEDISKVSDFISYVLGDDVQLTDNK